MPELIYKSHNEVHPTSWSSDGRFLMYAEQNKETGYDLAVLQMEGERKSMPLLDSKFNETEGRFSPDGHWIAYVSDQYGMKEVYLRQLLKGPDSALAVSGGMLQISQGGGNGPRWRGDGRELYYLASTGDIMTVEVTGKEEMEVGNPRPLFRKNLDNSLGSEFFDLSNWDVGRDGNRFLLPMPNVDSASSPFTIILNWTSLLEQ